MKPTDRLKDYIRNKDDELARLNLNLTKQLDIEVLVIHYLIDSSKERKGTIIK